MATRRISLIHASPAAIAPLARYCAEAEPQWEMTNLLDDGIMRQFRTGDDAAVESGLLSLVDRACSRYHAEAALITCSAASLGLMRKLSAAAPVPLVKIDAPMAEAAVRSASPIGALVTFPPTLAPTCALLNEVALSAGRAISIRTELREEALQALLQGDSAAHDRLLTEGARALHSAGAGVIVLAQVSMAHMREPFEREFGIPVFSSLETSRKALREALTR